MIIIHIICCKQNISDAFKNYKQNAFVKSTSQ